MKGYGEYKKIDAQWIEKIPSHWDAVRNKFILRERKKLSSTGSETLLSVSQYSGVTKKNFEKSVGIKAAESLVGYKIVKQHDIVMNIMLAWNGSTGVSRYEGVVSPAYAVFEAAQAANPYFLHYVFRCPLVTEYFKAYSTGIVDSRLRLYPEKMAALMTVLPPREEQDQIVRYLDTKVGNINKLIRIKQQQIALLKEKKQAIINQAVTKGLDSNAPMKDSGIAWIGQIPEGWEVSRLSTFAKFQNGINEASEFFTSGHPFVTYGDVYNNFELPTETSGVAQSCAKQHDIYSVRRGDIFFTRTSETIDEIGFSSACLEPIEKAVFSGFLIRVRPVENTLLPEYSKYFFRSSVVREFFSNSMNIVTRASMGQGLLKNLPVIIPSLAEQRKISHYLRTQEACFLELTKLTENALLVLTEYRTRLISDVVTGKVDVRGVIVHEICSTENVGSTDIEYAEDSIFEKKELVLEEYTYGNSKHLSDKSIKIANA